MTRQGTYILVRLSQFTQDADFLFLIMYPFLYVGYKSATYMQIGVGVIGAPSAFIIVYSLSTVMFSCRSAWASVLSAPESTRQDIVELTGWNIVIGVDRDTVCEFGEIYVLQDGQALADRLHANGL